MKPIVAALLFLVSTQLLRADDALDQTAAAVAKRIDDIQAELDSLDAHPWAGEYYAGEYYAGDGLGMSLRLWIAPQSGVAYHWHGCLGLYEQNFGTVDSIDSQLFINWELNNDDPYVADSRWLVVPFRTSVFLVPNRAIHRFCLSVRGNTSMPTMVLTSTSTQNQDALLRPQLPDAYKKFLDLAPIEAKVVSVGKLVTEKFSEKMTLLGQRHHENLHPGGIASH